MGKIDIKKLFFSYFLLHPLTTNKKKTFKNIYSRDLSVPCAVCEIVETFEEISSTDIVVRVE